MRRALAASLVAMAVGALAGCATTPYGSGDHAKVHVVTTTGILADLVRNVGGSRVGVHSLVPEGGDPHSYEPTLRDVRNVVYADLGFSNYALLEEHNVIKTLDANLRPGVPDVSLAEESVKYAADLIPLVENVNLDTIWLGLRVRGTGAALGANRDSDVLVHATHVTGPGKLIGYLTGSFGDPQLYFDSGNGFDAGDGYRDDTATLPPDAHTHMSWVFTKPGVYTLDLKAELVARQGERSVQLGHGRFTFAVGRDPYRVPGRSGAHVLDSGHADLAVDMDHPGARSMSIFADEHGGGEATQRVYDPARTVISVPDKARTTVPGEPQFRFLGHPGDTVYELPQAVLGAHVHGEIDPHLWQNVKNAEAYVKLIRDQLIAVDPDGTEVYTRNTARYLATLDRTDRYVRRTIAALPRGRRNLVTTHDAFGYLAAAYGMTVAGFVTPNPGVEPSLADRRTITRTIRELHVPAVFLEPNLVARSSTLTDIARDQHVRVCRIYGDAFDTHVTDYVHMMRFNADSIRRCLS